MTPISYLSWLFSITLIIIGTILYRTYSHSYYQYREWFRKSPFGSVILDKEEKIVECNEAFAHLCGLSINQLKGKPLSHFLKKNGCTPLEGLDQNIMNFIDGNGEQKIVSVHQRNVQFAKKNYQLITINDVTELQQSVQKITRMAYYDQLTGLANRQHFHETFEQLLSEAKQGNFTFACMLIDIDDFKQVNDTMGHLVGDSVLKIIANRLTHCVRDDDLVVRIGGDEFVILLPFTNKTYITEIANRMIKQLNDPIVIGDVKWTISPSIGISLFPDDGQDVDTLLERADQAMYLAKKQGKNNFCLSADALPIS